MKNELMEVMVTYTNNAFAEQLRPARSELCNYLNRQKIRLPENYRTEINLDAGEWLKNISVFMRRGYVLTIDYGYAADEFYHHSRKRGTLMCFRSHQPGDNPYIHIGKQDITAHVDFSGLKCWGEESNLEFAGFTDQLSFLKGLGIVSRIRQLEQESINTPAEQKKIKRLIETFLFGMGKRFKVLLLQKKAPGFKLSGLQFSHLQL
jgi:SAM-dependent MidA family methyltransferase